MDGLSSGYVKIAFEHGHWNSGFSRETWWFSSSLCQRLPGRVSHFTTSKRADFDQPSLPLPLQSASRVPHGRRWPNSHRSREPEPTARFHDWAAAATRWNQALCPRLLKMGYDDIPSDYVKIAIENWPFIVEFPIDSGDFRYVSLPEGNVTGV